jgi:hypothetical protein
MFGPERRCTMGNTATVSFKLTPEHRAALLALAAGRNQPVSELVRETVESALDLDGRARPLADPSARAPRRPT